MTRPALIKLDARDRAGKLVRRFEDAARIATRNGDGCSANEARRHEEHLRESIRVGGPWLIGALQFAENSIERVEARCGAVVIRRAA